MGKKQFELKSAKSTISLLSPLDDISHCRVEQIRWSSLNADDRIMHIVIKQFDNNEFYQSTSILNYTKSMSVIEFGSTPHIWESSTDKIDGSRPNPINLKQFEVLIYIDGILTADITPSNPMYLEISFF